MAKSYGSVVVSHASLPPFSKIAWIDQAEHTRKSSSNRRRTDDTKSQRVRRVSRGAQTTPCSESNQIDDCCSHSNASLSVHRGLTRQPSPYGVDIKSPPRKSVRMRSHSSLSDSQRSASPHSSTSFGFSSGGSDSSRSPLSSQTSITELSVSSPGPYYRHPPRIQVSSLLANPSTRSYHLEVVQHPLCTAEFGRQDLSRLPITPPIIARLTVRDPSGNPIIPEAELPFLVAHLSLFRSDGTRLDMGSYIGQGQIQQTPPILYGNLVSIVEQLEDPQGNMGLFFIFADASIRHRGEYQLGVTLSRVASPTHPGSGDASVRLAETRTHTFAVVPWDQYVASPPTRWTNCFVRQGARFLPNRT